MKNIKIDFKLGGLAYQDVLGFMGETAHGAQAIFFGAVRDMNQGRKVIRIGYDIFIPLAQNILCEVCWTAHETWGHDLKMGVVHAYGDIQVGELCVGIGVSAKHRDEAFRACRFLIEEIKHKVPIWKKEYYEDGESDWVTGHALCAHAI